jgi:hypothetical protein
MCFPKKQTAPNPLAQIDSERAIAQGAYEARLRRRRAGAGADVLTGPMGIPATTRLGQST